MAVAFSGEEGSAGPVLDRLDRALGQIESYEPRRLSRIRRDLARILVVGEETTRSAYYVHSLHWCVITERHAGAAATTAEALASKIVHEATHARLAGVGITYAAGMRGRLEIVCAKQEIAFLRSLPNAAELVAKEEERIARWSTAGEVPWSDSQFLEDDLRLLRDYHVPGWAIRFVAWIRGRGTGAVVRSNRR